MGDFIYADVPWRTNSQEGYYKLYRQTFASKDYKRIYENIPTFHIYDDHEIVNVSERFSFGSASSTLKSPPSVLPRPLTRVLGKYTNKSPRGTY